MSHYYKKHNYINEGDWRHWTYPNYYFKDECLMLKSSIIKLKDAKLFKNVIVVTKILTNIITKYCSIKN